MQLMISCAKVQGFF